MRPKRTASRCGATWPDCSTRAAVSTYRLRFAAQRSGSSAIDWPRPSSSPQPVRYLEPARLHWLLPQVREALAGLHQLNALHNRSWCAILKDTTRCLNAVGMGNALRLDLLSRSELFDLILP